MKRPDLIFLLSLIHIVRQVYFNLEKKIFLIRTFQGVLHEFNPYLRVCYNIGIFGVNPEQTNIEIYIIHSLKTVED